jgi:hypothetical protein
MLDSHSISGSKQVHIRGVLPTWMWEGRRRGEGVLQKARDLTKSVGIVLLHLLQHIVGEECKTGDGAHSFQEAA